MMSASGPFCLSKTAISLTERFRTSRDGLLLTACAHARARLLLSLLVAFIVRRRAGRRLPSSGLTEGREAGEARRAAQVFLDAKKLVVLGDAVCARQAPGLDLPGVCGDGEVCDERVLSLARTVRDDCGAACA